MLLVVVFTCLAISALGQRSEARNGGGGALSALAAERVSQLDADPELGLLLAVEAAERETNREAEDALRRALTSSRLRAVGPRPRGPVRSAAVPDDDSRPAHRRRSRAAPADAGQAGGGGDIASFGAGLVDDATLDRTGRLIVTADKDGAARIVNAWRQAAT